MLETLGSLDRSLFYFVNATLANPVTDFVMPIITSDNLLRALYAVALVIMLWKGNKQLRWLVGFSALALLVTDQVSSNFLKPWIARQRPCQVLTDVHLLVACGSGFSMPSSHAANMFAQTGLFAIQYPKYRLSLFTAALLVSLSRVFVGVHYPADIVVGAMVGLAIAVAMSAAYMKALPYVVRD